VQLAYSWVNPNPDPKPSRKRRTKLITSAFLWAKDSPPDEVGGSDLVHGPANEL